MSDGGYSKFGSATKNTMCNVETVIKKKKTLPFLSTSHKNARINTPLLCII